jgi:hypothetical protein
MFKVNAIRRRNIRSSAPDQETRFTEGDGIVLRGRQENLEAADMYLMQARASVKILRMFQTPISKNRSPHKAGFVGSSTNAILTQNKLAPPQLVSLFVTYH